ncbi:hypothetical protein ACO0KY_03465 [Undibacterium sp. Dicai25W]|uniref:hypothetical protein n=1 Tax=Undibacterium sp. Dicai25W TaxID=3413034 RepID=UPI003BF1A606
MNTQLDASIPVLTEVIPLEEISSEDTAGFSAPAASGATEVSDSLDDQVREHGAISEEQWQLLEQTLRENVLKQVLARVDFVLEHRVRDSLADVLQTAVSGLAEEIRTGLKNSLEDVVTRAVNQEITKAKILK